MKKATIIILMVITIFLVSGCIQKQAKQAEPADQAQEQQQTCTQMWICANENTKAYRRADCAFEQATDCPSGCENGECKSASQKPQEEKPEEANADNQKEQQEQTEEPAKKECAIGWACLDSKRLGYRSSGCMFNQVNECQYGCKDNACITTAPPEQNKEETFSLAEGKASMGVSGSRYSDFSKGQILQKEVYDQDVKVEIYSISVNRDYFRVTSPTSNLWFLEKKITDAVRADCVENSKSKGAYGELKSGKTMCIKTKENNIALMGGLWEGPPKESTELSWKYYS